MCATLFILCNLLFLTNGPCGKRKQDLIYQVIISYLCQLALQGAIDWKCIIKNARILCFGRVQILFTLLLKRGTDKYFIT